MTNPDELEALAVRVEALSGPDREADIAIAVSIGWCPAGIDPRLFANPEIRWLYTKKVPRFTALLDAAMDLVPEGLEWEVFRWKNASKKFPWLASSKVRLGSINEPTIEVFAAVTPALALCAAALRARARTLHPLSSDTEGMVK